MCHLLPSAPAAPPLGSATDWAEMVVAGKSADGELPVEIRDAALLDTTLHLPLPSLGFMFEESLVFGDLTWPPQTATSPTTGAEVRT